MLSWRLWRRLNRSLTGHPAYQRVIIQPPQPLPWYASCAIIIAAPFVLLPGLIFMSAVYGLRWVVQIAGAIASQREAGMYDLLALTPLGAFGISWVITSAYLHRNESLEQIQSAGAWLMRGFFTLVVMLSAASLAATPVIPGDADPALGQFIIPLYLVTFVLAVYLDHVQSVTLACIVGMLVPTYRLRRTDAGLSAFGVYLLIQMTTYALTFLLGFSLIPAVFDSFRWMGFGPTFSLPVIRLAVFWGSREVIIRHLWLCLVRETNTTISEVQAVVE
jgi:hypothetical protein